MFTYGFPLFLVSFLLFFGCKINRFLPGMVIFGIAFLISILMMFHGPINDGLQSAKSFFSEANIGKMKDAAHEVKEEYRLKK